MWVCAQVQYLQRPEVLDPLDLVIAPAVRSQIESGIELMSSAGKAIIAEPCL